MKFEVKDRDEYPWDTEIITVAITSPVNENGGRTDGPDAIIRHSDADDNFSIQKTWGNFYAYFRMDAGSIVIHKGNTYRCYLPKFETWCVDNDVDPLDPTDEEWTMFNMINLE